MSLLHLHGLEAVDKLLDGHDLLAVPRQTHHQDALVDPLGAVLEDALHSGVDDDHVLPVVLKHGERDHVEGVKDGKDLAGVVGELVSVSEGHVKAGGEDVVGEVVGETLGHLVDGEGRVAVEEGVNGVEAGGRHFG